MASYNRVILLGNLTRDIELRYTPSGMAVADVGLAASEKRKSQNGDWIEDTLFVDVTLWGKTAEVASEYLSKGSPIFIEGKLKFETWEKDGTKHYKHKVIADRMQMLGGKNDARREGTSQPQNDARRGGGSQGCRNEPVGADDIPF